MFFVTKNKSPQTVRAEVLVVGARPVGIGLATALKTSVVVDMLPVEFLHLRNLSRLLPHKAERIESAPGKLVTNEQPNS